MSRGGKHKIFGVSDSSDTRSSGAPLFFAGEVPARLSRRITPASHEIDRIAHSCGLRHARELRREHVRIVESAGRSVALGTLYPYPQPGVRHDRSGIVRAAAA